MDERSPNAFEAALAGAAPPAEWPAPLAALFWAAKGGVDSGGASPDGAGSGEAAWDRAHALVQDAPGADAAWVHAHLHRIEGDLGNARYWYRRAGRGEPTGSIDEERSAIAGTLMSAPSYPGR